MTKPKMCARPGCGTVFTGKAEQTLCSRSCSAIAGNAARLAAREVEWALLRKECARDGCDTQFGPTPARGVKGWEAQKFCSVACTGKGPRSRPASVDVKVCEACGDRFARSSAEGPTRWLARRFCSQACVGSGRVGVSAVPKADLVESTGLYRPVWRPAGFVLRPGDEGYTEVAS